MENTWKSAARHWWERMRQAERERDELLQKLEESLRYSGEWTREVDQDGNQVRGLK